MSMDYAKYRPAIKKFIVKFSIELQSMRFFSLDIDASTDAFMVQLPDLFTFFEWNMRIPMGFATDLAQHLGMYQWIDGLMD